MKAVFAMLPVLLLVAGLLGATAARAAEEVDVTRFDGQALSGASGAVGVNMAAGSANLQANLRAMVLGPQAPSSGPLVLADQQTASAGNEAPGNRLDLIGGSALSGASGIIGVNQTSGAGNSQANLATLSILGAEPVSNHDLLETCGKVGQHAPPAPGQRVDLIEGQALSGATGLVQVSQSAGSGNSIRNSIGIALMSMTIE